MIILVFLVQAAWQQRVSYDIYAFLETDEHTLFATARLNYKNNSPHDLDTLYFFLHADAFHNQHTYYAREANKVGDERFLTMSQDDFGGVRIDKVMSEGEFMKFNITETILSIPLKQTIGTGDSAGLSIDFTLKIPRELREGGYWPGHYEMTYWYPKICVFDTDGWNLEPLHPLGSTHGEFGDYDITVDLPEDYVIVGTGKKTMQTEKELPDYLSAAVNEPKTGGRQIVRFLARNVSDFAWVCDRNFSVQSHKIDNVNVSIYYRPEHEKHHANTYSYVVDAVSRFNDWFGDYPYEDLNLVDGFYQGPSKYPQLIIMDIKEDPLTRLFESQLVNEIGWQWFGAVVGVNDSQHGWLGQGLASYATIRYMDDKYGKDNSLIKTSFFPPLSLRYYHRLYYYLMQTNQVEKPVSSPASSYADIPYSYTNSVKSKPALFFLSLEKLYGRDQFDEILRQYYRDYAFEHAKSEDFVEVCGEVNERDLGMLFDSFLHSTKYCDWAVYRITEYTAEIENRGELMIPIDVHVTTEFGEQVYYIDGQRKRDTIVVPDTLGEITQVVLDPSEYTMEADYWNNYAPRRVSIKPIFDFDWPSFSTYQILWTPYLWYDTYDGVVGGFYIFGDKFADFDFVKGGYQVTARYIYGFGSKRHYPSVNYQTPIIFKDGVRTRLLFGGSRARGGDNVHVGFSTSLGRPFTRKPQVGLTNLLSYDELSSYAGLDSIDWELGRNISFDNQFIFRHSVLNITSGISFAHHAIGSEWEYLKTTFEVKKTFEIPIPVNARLFVGVILGNAPRQQRLFLSGLLRINWMADLVFNQSGTYSPQERLHIPGDGNMRGYQSLHLNSDQMYTLNLEFPARSLVQIFTDIGYYDRFAFDVGVSLVISAETIARLPLYGLSISVNLPLYTYTPGEPWKLRWSLGFSL
ncbi:MAG: hypothetical protein JSV53_11865 [candidate division WOR-3 bacterium]|nr:MAG: hypothetical protein JSV53_11865 [candidate division WOR-3 bacterium]